MTFRVFYSWQSDLPAKRNRNLIQRAAEVALKELRRDGVVDAALDRDTKGVGGTPDIAETIFRKIRECDIFLADVTPVSKRGRSSVLTVPNPNVMTELGFAIGEVTWDAVICVANTGYGPADRLPFHLKQRRRPITYDYGPSVRTRASDVRDELVRALKLAFGTLARRAHPRTAAVAFEEPREPHHDTWDGRRIIHTAIRNVSGRSLSCVGTVVIEGSRGERLSELSARFSANPEPGPNALFAAERWESVAGTSSDIPLVLKSSGEPVAHPFSYASPGVFPGILVWTSGSQPLPLPQGAFRVRVEIMYSSHAIGGTVEKSFILKHDGLDRAGLTIEDV